MRPPNRLVFVRWAINRNPVATQTRTSIQAAMNGVTRSAATCPQRPNPIQRATNGTAFRPMTPQRNRIHGPINAMAIDKIRAASIVAIAPMTMPVTAMEAATISLEQPMHPVILLMDIETVPDPTVPIKRMAHITKTVLATTAIETNRTTIQGQILIDHEIIPIRSNRADNSNIGAGTPTPTPIPTPMAMATATTKINLISDCQTMHRVQMDTIKDRIRATAAEATSIVPVVFRITVADLNNNNNNRTLLMHKYLNLSRSSKLHSKTTEIL